MNNLDKNNALKNNVINTLADTLDDLVSKTKKETGLGNNQIAEKIGIGQGQLSKIINAQTELGISSLVKIAKYFNVSTDYLLGLTNLKSPNNDYKILHKTLGLLDENINYLMDLKNEDADGFEMLLTLLKKDIPFTEFMLCIREYLYKRSAGNSIKENKFIDNPKEIGYLELFRITEIAKDIAKELEKKQNDYQKDNK